MTMTNFTKLLILKEIAENPGSNIAYLSKKSGYCRSKIFECLKELRDRGYVKTYKKGRVRLVTQKGYKELEKL